MDLSSEIVRTYCREKEEFMKSLSDPGEMGSNDTFTY